MFHSSSQVLLTVLGGHLSSSLGNLGQSLSPLPPHAFSGLCSRWWGLPGRGEAVSISQESPGWVLWSAALPGTGRLLGLAGAEMFLECERRAPCDLAWDSARLAAPLPQRWPKINIAQIAGPSNKQSEKTAELPLRLRLIKVGSDCRSQSLLGVCSNEAFAAP